MLAWAALLAMAGLIRLVDLDGLPLTLDEAARSFDAMRVADGEVPQTWRGELAAASTSYLFRIFGDSEFVARLVPALAGLGLVATVYSLRPYVGQTGALVAAALLTFSPLFVLHSRFASEYAVGPMVSVVIAASLSAYMRNPRTSAAFPLVVSLALAPLTDAPAVVALLAAIAFAGLEATVFRNSEIGPAWRTFRSSPVQWISALLVLAAAIQLGVTHFGTHLDGDLPGLRLWADMFDQPRDSRQAEYHLALLLSYDWPIFLAGSFAFFFVAWRLLRRRSVEPFERFLLLWTLAAALTLALVTQRASGQLLILLLPLALLTGRLFQELVSTLEPDTLRRWWPVAAVLVMLAAIGALLMTEWASGNASSIEQAMLAGVPFASIAVVAVIFVRSRLGGTAATAAACLLIAAAFMAHSSLAVAFDGGADFAVDARQTPRAEQLKATLDRLSAERDSDIVLDADFTDELGWTLRDSRVLFGGQPDAASILVTTPDAAPSGFAGLPEVWRIAEGWYPDDVLAPRRMWRWVVFREAFGPTDFVEVRIFVRTI